MFRKIIALFAATALLSACVSDDVLESAASSNSGPATQADQATLSEPIIVETPAASTTTTTNALAVLDPATATDGSVAIDGTIDANTSPAIQNGVSADEAIGNLQPPAVRGPAKTYLINGLLSAVPFIGYGFRNLNKKMPEAKLYSYMGVVEGPAAIAPAVIKEAEAAWRADPTTRINLIGISLGADLITLIAEKLHEKGVPVAYLGIVDGTNLRPINSNVKVADNLTCSNLDCTRAKARLAKGNTTTVLSRKVYQSSHIPLGDNNELHARVIAASR